jgi:ABC-type transport system involved in multi-copper enzyme maturation permease subunit
MTMHKLKNWLIDSAMLLKLSLRLQLGRWFWLIPILVLAWPGFLAVALVFGWFDASVSFGPENAQSTLIGIPLYLVAVGLGVRVIAGEIEQRTLEVTYTVPGGAQRVWLSKLFAATIPIVVAGALLAIIAAAFFTEYPLLALYGSLQGAVVYLVLSMGFGALLRSEITAVLVVSVVLLMNGLMTGFGEAQSRLSPFFNPLAVREQFENEVLAWTIQNRIGYALFILAIYALACVRAERREQLLRA